MPTWHHRFGPFTLDLAASRLLRDGRVLAVTARDLSVLRHLALRAGQVVSTDEILESVWADAIVVRGVVKAVLHRLRTALEDSHPEATYIATVGRLGYRFVAKVSSLPSLDSHGASGSPQGAASLSAEREAELARLRDFFARASEGKRQIVFVRGDGTPDTMMLVQALLARAESESSAWCAYGRCILPLGPSEPYRPLLEGLRSLARGPLGAELVAILRRHAPLWLTKLPALVAPAAREALARESLGATPARMTREFQDAVEALASIRPLVFALEDLHWADRATLDVLSAIAVGRRDSRLLVLGTYGPDELDSHPSSFGNVLHD